MTRAKDISKILTDADISGNIDVDGVTNLDVVDIDGAVDMASTLTVTGVSILNGGIDVAGDIILDADGEDIRLKDGGTEWGVLSNPNGDFGIQAKTQDKDIVFYGNDGGSTTELLRLDTSDAGEATFNSSVHATGTVEAKTSFFPSYHQLLFSPHSLPVAGINCHIPVAPSTDLA